MRFSARPVVRRKMGCRGDPTFPVALALSGSYLGTMAYKLAELEELSGIVHRARHGVALTGAGISAESGVPTFRGNEGLWEKFRPEDLATMQAFIANSKLVWEWYNWRRELIRRVKPNAGHYALVEI